MTSMEKTILNNLKKIFTLSNITSVIVGIVLGLIPMLFLKFALPKSEMKKLELNGEYQKRIENEPYISAFFQHLKYIENKEIEKIWDESFTKNRQNKFNNKNNVSNTYVLTGEYEVQYIIPVSEKKDRANFWVLFKFTDRIDSKEMIHIRSLGNKKIKELREIDEIYIEHLRDEIYNVLSIRYELNKEDEFSCKQKILEELQDLPMREMIYTVWWYPFRIARKLGLIAKEKPSIDVLDSPQEGFIWSSVIMVKEGEKWKVEDFETIAMRAWEFKL